MHCKYWREAEQLKPRFKSLPLPTDTALTRLPDEREILLALLVSRSGGIVPGTNARDEALLLGTHKIVLRRMVPKDRS